MSLHPLTGDGPSSDHHKTKLAGQHPSLKTFGPLPAIQLVVISLTVQLLVPQCEGRAGGARRLPDDVPFMDYGPGMVAPSQVREVELGTTTSRMLEDLKDLQISTNFDHSEPFVPNVYNAWWSHQQDQTTPEENGMLPHFEQPDNTLLARKYEESGNTVREFGRGGGNGDNSAVFNSRAIFDSPYRGRGSSGDRRRLNQFWQQTPDDPPSYSADSDTELESEVDPPEKLALLHLDSFAPDFEPETSNDLQCYICNQTSSSSRKINCNLQRGVLYSCPSGFNICLQYCDARAGTTVRTCGRSYRKRNDWNCRVLRDTIPTLAHCSECSYSTCNIGMNCRLDAPFHVSLPPNLPPPPVQKHLAPSLNRWRTHNRLQVRRATNFIQETNHPPRYPRNKNKRKSAEEIPPGASDFNNTSNSHHRQEPSYHSNEPLNEEERQQLEAEGRHLDGTKHELTEQQELIGGHVLHNESEESIVMGGNSSCSCEKCTNNNSTPNLQEDDSRNTILDSRNGSPIQEDGPLR
ncbi:hypothetical protein WDU94_002600 [Cyamophila willieti]